MAADTRSHARVQVMSQQTQVSRAAEYFKRWIAKWPTVQALAAAELDEVNSLWAGKAPQPMLKSRANSF